MGGKKKKEAPKPEAHPVVGPGSLGTSFEEIAAAAIASAEELDCEFDEFVEGLETIHEAIKSRLEQARDEAPNH